MFNYSKNTEVNMLFKVNELLKTIQADKATKADSANISLVKLTNTLSAENTKLEASEKIREVYVIDIALDTKQVPMLFIQAFNKYISFQTLFRIHFGQEIKYFISLKTFEEDNVKVLKLFESDWLNQEKLELPITLKLETLFKEMVAFVSGYKFRQDELFEDYVSRLESIKKLKAEIEKQTKTMNNEKQPNLRMALNDKIKIMKKELATLGGDLTNQAFDIKEQTIKKCSHPSVHTKQNDWGCWDVCNVCGQRIEDSFHYFNHYDGEDHEE